MELLLPIIGQQVYLTKDDWITIIDGEIDKFHYDIPHYKFGLYKKTGVV